ncbi:YitT family protein [Caldalkalibacillus thermarum TA2.A1]|uniref:YitT family protein n=1 Tax=Caldalkalibacillus thermarum (strain TA2.A1) TaxID=986075 RepID=A0A8X8I7Q1_CALTT|nr:YitT family protein [Caldalkalibacillus thermarum TA2.A1]
MEVEILARRKRGKPLPHWLVVIKDYTYLFAGATLVALAFNLFLYPNRIASGGVVGISTILGYLTGIEPGYIQWGINIPLFVAGVAILGKQFGLKTLVGTVCLPLAVVLTSQLSPVTDNPFLAALFGGVGVGAGLGLVFRGRGSTGGVDLAAQIVHKFTGLRLGLGILIIDGLIVISSAVVFNIELALYALIALFITSKTIDVVQMGMGYAKVAFIISSQQEELRRAILHDLDRGVTRLTATGGYTDRPREMLMCVVNQMEVTKLKELVRRIDPSAFVVVTDANEVLGEGFKVE